jgi:hypothetical protein
MAVALVLVASSAAIPASSIPAISRRHPDRPQELLTLKTAKPALRDIRGAKVSFVKPVSRVRARHLKGGEFLRHASLTEVIW